MDTNTPTPQVKASYRTHKRQFAWQILVPILVAVLLFLTAGGLTIVRTSNDQASLWADISTMWLLQPVLLFGVLFLVVLVGLIVVMTRILKGIPPYSAQVQDFFLRVRDGVRKATDKTASVVIALQSAAAAARRVVKRE